MILRKTGALQNSIICQNSIKLFVNKVENYCFLKLMSSNGCQPKKIPCNYHGSVIVSVLLGVSQRPK